MYFFLLSCLFCSIGLSQWGHLLLWVHVLYWVIVLLNHREEIQWDVNCKSNNGRLWGASGEAENETVKKVELKKDLDLVEKAQGLVKTVSLLCATGLTLAICIVKFTKYLSCIQTKRYKEQLQPCCYSLLLRLCSLKLLCTGVGLEQLYLNWL